MDKEILVVGIATYKRPKMLKEALESLRLQRVPERVTVNLVVADNQENSDAQHIMKSFQKDFPFEVQYVCVRERGIVQVRNRILHIALALNARYLAFIDDDEIASQDWLLELLKCQTKYNAHAVEGKVIYKLPKECPNWIVRGKFFGNMSKLTGSRLKYACTNNVLIDLNFIRKYGGEFDIRLNHSGGSDTHFFDELRRKGGLIVRCEEATTLETVPVSKVNEKWILQRAFKSGVTAHIRNSIRLGKLKGYLMSVLYIINFMFRLIFKLFRFDFKSKEGRVHMNRDIAMLKGTFHAMLGKRFEAYKIIHGK